MGKSVIVTYILWFFGGWFGIHHFYLGRDKQAFVWWCLFGGYGGVGLMNDLFRIPRYVQEANYEHTYVEEFKELMKKKPKPPYCWYRLIGQIVFGNLLSWLLYAAIPVEPIMGISLWWLISLVPLASAIGVYTVGNIGREEGSIRNALIGAYIPLFFYTMANPKYYWSSVLSAVAFRTQVKWKRTPPKKRGLCRRVATLALYGTIYASLWGSFLYFNMVITTEHGETIKFRDSVKNLLKSPMIVELRESLQTLWQYYRIHGFGSLWAEIIARFDPLGERNALRVLDLPKGATQEQITRKWRQLTRQWHPDKFQGEEEKAMAQEKFLEIKEAFDKLSVIHTKRKKQNARSRTMEEGEPSETHTYQTDL